LTSRSTVSPAENLKLKSEFESANAEFIECPVIGTASVAEARNLQTLFGGTNEQFQKYNEIFHSFGPQVRYIGEIPAASTFKMAFNQIVIGQVITFSHSLGMVQNSGFKFDDS
jgi:3-hydroxyisobutyrate dehydrogenase-like beta-hydroxyacid dehydrogenase